MPAGAQALGQHSRRRVGGRAPAWWKRWPSLHFLTQLLPSAPRPRIPEPSASGSQSPKAEGLLSCEGGGWFLE